MDFRAFGFQAEVAFGPAVRSGPGKNSVVAGSWIEEVRDGRNWYIVVTRNNWADGTGMAEACESGALIELLFSRNPFVQQCSGQFSNIRPNLTQTLELPPKQAATTFELPKQLHSGNVLVEITGAGQTKSRAYYARALAVQVLEHYGQIHVKHSDTGKPLAKV